MTAPTPAAGGAGVDELLDPAFLAGVEELPPPAPEDRDEAPPPPATNGAGDGRSSADAILRRPPASTTPGPHQ